MSDKDKLAQIASTLEALAAPVANIALNAVERMAGPEIEKIKQAGGALLNAGKDAATHIVQEGDKTHYNKHSAKHRR